MVLDTPKDWETPHLPVQCLLSKNTRTKGQMTACFGNQGKAESLRAGACWSRVNAFAWEAHPTWGGAGGWGEGQHQMGVVGESWLSHFQILIPLCIHRFKFYFNSSITYFNFFNVSGKKCHWHWLWEGEALWPGFYSLPPQATRGSDTNVGSPRRVRMGTAGTDYIS